MADPAPAPQAPAPDQPMTKAERRQLRADLVTQREDRIKTEATIVASLCGGMSLRQVAAQVGMSKSQVDRIYKRHQDRNWDTPEIVRAELGLRLDTLVRALWPIAVGAKDTPGSPAPDKRVQVAAAREVRMITAEQAALAAAYKPAALDVNVSGGLTVQRDVRVVHVMETVARIRVAQLQAPPPALAAPQTNGHGPVANGNEAA